MSVVSLVWNYYHGLILLPNDAIAHINDARRIFDSQAPGLSQLGTVWLPLPQLLQAPFLLNDTLWRSGIGGCIPSMVAYVAGALGIFRLVGGRSSRTVAWLAALIYALNPNLVYMQATPMAEAIYLALFIWAVVYFDEFRRVAATSPQSARRLLLRCGLSLSAAMLVRYDGWFLAACIFAGLLLVLWRGGVDRREFRVSVAQFAAIIGLTAGLWLAYNHFVYGNSLDFVTGAYSVRGITERTTMAAYPGRGDARTAAIFFLRSATLNTGAAWGHLSLLNLAFVALMATVYFSRKHIAGLLLWAPVVFYVINIAWNSVIIFLPEWLPFSYYNVRYGLQLLPAIAVFVALGCGFLSELFPPRYTMAAAVLMVAFSYGGVLRDGPICLGEAQANGAPRQALDINVGRALRPLPPAATFMLDLRMRSGVALQAGIQFKRIVHPGMYAAWKQSIAHPSAAADYVIAVDGDEVDQAVRAHPQGLELIATVDTPGQPRAFIYRAMR
ncbi:MAG TPA: hypothetical protein VNW97_21980 [Candidatus Saccharimonadales bacterium]|nr:hypothetical protein [Candidatus Saccharimonadales bacterium]